MSAAASAAASSLPRPKMNGSPPFEPNDRLAGSGFVDQPPIDLFLRRASRPADFMRLVRSACGRREPQEQRIDQAVVKHEVGRSQAAASP